MNDTLQILYSYHVQWIEITISKNDILRTKANKLIQFNSNKIKLSK